MRMLVLGLVVAAVCGASCARRSASGGAEASPVFAIHETAFDPTNRTIITAEKMLIGKVVRAHPTARFVVVNFPVGRLPAVGQQMAVFRRGLRVGEVRITGPHEDDNIVADLVAGEAESGDDVRER